MTDCSDQILHTVHNALQEKQAMSIVGGNSKAFYGNPVDGIELCTREHSGIVDYQPSELVITARSGTALNHINKTLHEHNQMLAFEPPQFGGNATLGGTVACGLSGPRRPFCGAVRDFVLGCRIINGRAECLSFGGQVMKNVAGYDVSRLMTGSLGTLGVILEVSLKVLPKPECEKTLVMNAKPHEALDIMAARASQALPLSGMCYDGENVYMRLSGYESAVQAACKKVSGDELTESSEFWRSINEQQHYFFQLQSPLWRLSLAPATLPLGLPGDWFIDWGGALRWLKTDMEARHVRDAAEAEGGHAICFNANPAHSMQPPGGIFHPLPEKLNRLHQRIKFAFDPQQIFNPGRMYQDS